MEEVIISRFKKDDLQGILNMIEVAFKTPALDKVYEEDVKSFWLTEYTEEEILELNRTRNLYVAKLNGKVVGSGAVGEDSDAAYISAVFIDPTVQGKGIGRKIMEALEQDELAQKYKKVYLTAALSAGRFYQKLGYTYKYDIPEIVLDGCLDVVYMEKELK